jgi:hypothetical protein
MTRLRRWARSHHDLIILLVVVFAIGGGNALATSDQVNAYQAGQRREQAAQEREGLKLERQLCTTFGNAAALVPPAGNPQKNPSRAYLQGEHLVWTGVLADLRCRR